MKTHDFILGPIDTDSISFCKPDMSEFTEEEQKNLLDEINSYMPELVKYAEDGYYKTIVAIRAKNYILYDGEDLTIKGSALRASMKEIRLQEFIDGVIKLLIYDKKEDVLDLYNSYIKEIHNLTNINKWCSKKTITESVLNPERTNEQKVLDAVKGHKVQMGDKIRVYFAQDQSLKLEEDWTQDHCTNTLMSKLYKTLDIFKTVLDMSQFTKFTLKSHEVQCKLAQVLGNPLPEKVKRTRKFKESVV